MACQGRGGRAFRRKAPCPVLIKGQPGPEQGAQLVLGGDHGDPGPGIVKGRKHRLGAQKAHIVHHHLAARFGFVQVIAADAMHGRGPSGRNGQVVGVGETGDHRMRQPVGAGRANAFQGRHQTGLDGNRQILRLAAVQTDDEGRHLGPGIGAVVDDNGHMASFRRRVWRVRPGPARAGRRLQPPCRSGCRGRRPPRAASHVRPSGQSRQCGNCRPRSACRDR